MTKSKEYYKAHEKVKARYALVDMTFTLLARLFILVPLGVYAVFFKFVTSTELDAMQKFVLFMLFLAAIAVSLIIAAIQGFTLIGFGRNIIEKPMTDLGERYRENIE